MRFSLYKLLKVFSFLISDNLVHGRARGWHWFIWCCLSGTWTSSACVHASIQMFYLILCVCVCIFIHKDVFINSLIPSLMVQAKCLETGEAVAIKKVLQDKRYKNRELQIMRILDHPNVVHLRHCFFSTTEKDELYLNLVLEFISETVYRVSKHYIRMTQPMPIIFVQLYAYQVNNETLHISVQ